jgi:hypothetical protein
MMKKVRFRTLGCYPLTGAVESEADTCRRSSGDAAHQDLRAAGPRHRPRLGRLHGKEEARGLFLMESHIRPDRHRHRAYLKAQRAQEPAALHHLRQRGRRQEHPHRPPAVRIEDAVRGPARCARSRLEEVRHHRARDRLRPAGRWPGRPSASRASPSTWPTASSPPTSASSSSPTPRATSSTPATWSPAPPPADVAIMMVDARKGVLDPDPPPQLPGELLGIRTSWWRSTRWIWSTTRKRPSTTSSTTTAPSPPGSDLRASPSSRCRRSRATTSPTPVRPCPGTTAPR